MKKSLLSLSGPVDGNNLAPALNITIICKGCNKSVPYATAINTGWTYDPKGEPFEAYFCEACSK